jgi:rhamnosyltransferase subunit B
LTKTPDVIVIGLGSAGDVYPHIGLALALGRRGHSVLLVAPSVFRPVAERTGLEFAGLLSDEEWKAALNDPNLWHPFRSFPVVARRLILPALRPVYEIIASRCEPGRTVVVASGLAFGARIAQEKLGVPLATVHLQPTMVRSVVRPVCFGFPNVIAHLPLWARRQYLAAADRWIIDPLLVGETNAFRAELGLAPVRRLFNGWIHSPQLTIGLFPDWFAPPPPDWPPNVVLTGFPLWDAGALRSSSADLEEFLAAGEPPVIFTAGTAMTQAARFFQVSAEACRTGRRRGIFLTQFPEQLPSPLPEGVRHFDYVPFSAVLPRAAALVHHGGIGTLAQAIAAGIPQLVVPSTHDQPDNAVRLRALGVGDFLLPRAYTAANLIARLDRLAAPAVRKACQDRAASVDGPQALEAACGLIERLQNQ